jgi:hypothetical protein
MRQVPQSLFGPQNAGHLERLLIDSFLITQVTDTLSSTQIS